MNTEVFLFGDGEGNDAFNCFTDPFYREGTFKNFESFKGMVDSLLGNFAYDEEENICVERGSTKRQRVFSVPDNVVLQRWYEKYGKDPT